MNRMSIKERTLTPAPVPDGKRAALALLIAALILAVPVMAGTDTWTTTGPLTSGTGDRVISALAIGPDDTLYAGTGNGRVWSYTMSIFTPPAPVASFTGAPRSGTVPLTVQFNDSSSHTPLVWNWSFGDGAWYNTTAAASRNASHQYAAAGTYTVGLTVSNTGGSDTATSSGYIVVTSAASAPIAPVASFSSNKTEGDRPLAVKFTDTSTNAPTSWTWDFSDGGTSAEQNPVHRFTAAGTWTVKLTATNAAGSSGKSTNITVIEPVVESNSFAVPGIQTGTGGYIAVTAANSTQSGNTVNVTAGTGAWKYLNVRFADTPVLDGTGNTWTGTVGSVTAVTTPVAVPIASVGSPSVQVSVNMNAMPGSTAAITQTITKDPDPAMQSSFSLAATTAGEQIDEIAYTLNIAKTGIANRGDGGVIQSATLTMTISPAWVAAHGGISRLAVIHRADDGTTQILRPVLTGTDATGNYILTIQSDDGLSAFVLAALSPVSSASSGSSTVSSASSGDSGPADFATLSPTSTTDPALPDGSSGPWTTHYVSGATHITQVDLQTYRTKKDLFILAEKPDALPADIPPPGMTVYEYQKIDLYRATGNDVYKAVIRFAVSESWIDGHKMTYRDVQLLRYHDNVWEDLDTEYAGTKDGNYLYRATCGGFSYFATALVKNATIVPARGTGAASPPVAVSGDPAGTISSGMTIDPTSPVRSVPSVPQQVQTTVPPPAPGPTVDSFAMPVLISAGCALIIGAGWYLRRWWRYRQNPALFRKYD